MKQQTAFVIACGFTAFLLVGGSAVVTNWRDRTTDATAAEPALTQTAPVNAAAQERAVFLAREAVYQQRIAEANRRLTQSATVVAAAAATSTAASAVTNVAANPAPQIPVMQAARIAVTEAMAHSADAQPQRAELVNFQGAIAYEITLNNGVVYVDAASGTILASQWAEQSAGKTLEATAPQTAVVEAPAQPTSEEDEHKDD